MIMYGDAVTFRDYSLAAGYDLTAFTDEQIARALRMASLRLDAEFRARWGGERASAKQVNEFPRVNLVGAETGIEYDSLIVPDAVIEASFEVAYYMLMGYVNAVSATKTVAVISKESKSLISGMNKSVEYDTTSSSVSVSDGLYASLESLFLYDVLKKKSSNFRAVKCL